MAVTFWLSFAGGDPDKFLGCVLVDNAEDLVTARTKMMLASVTSPGGQCAGAPVDHAIVPDEFLAAFLTLPRLTLLQKDDLRCLGPLVNLAGEPR